MTTFTVTKPEQAPAGAVEPQFAQGDSGSLYIVPNPGEVYRTYSAGTELVKAIAIIARKADVDVGGTYKIATRTLLPKGTKITIEI